VQFRGDLVQTVVFGKQLQELFFSSCQSGSLQSLTFAPRFGRTRSDFGEKLFEYIRTIDAQTPRVTRVKCILEGTIDNGSIIFRASGEKRGKKDGRKIDHTDRNQALQTLLLPYNTGIAVKGKYSWDPLTDFLYRYGGKELQKELVSRIQLDKTEGV